MLIELFKTEERAKVLSYVMFCSSFSVAEVSRATGVTKGLVSRYLRLLEEHGLLQKEGREYSPHDSAHSRAIKLLLNLERIDLSTLFLGFARGLGLYRSWEPGARITRKVTWMSGLVQIACLLRECWRGCRRI